MRVSGIASRSLRALGQCAAPVVLLIMLAGCGRGAPATSSPGSPAGATAPATAVASPDASPLAPLPPGFPVMPGSEEVASLPDDPELVARWTSTGNGAQVYDFFVQALPAAGFGVDQLAPGGEAAIITFSGPGDSQYAVSLTAQDAGTRIDLRLRDVAPD